MACLIDALIPVEPEEGRFLNGDGDDSDSSIYLHTPLP
jgi:hypothetical protein